MSKFREALRLRRAQDAEASQEKSNSALTQGLANDSVNEATEGVSKTTPKAVTNVQPSFDGPRHTIDPEALIRHGLLAAPDRANQIADEFRLIKRPLIENATGKHNLGSGLANVIMVASAVPGAGKTFCSMNLAVSISRERELNVLLVDADVAKPHISTACGLDSRPGLTDLLEDTSLPIEDVLVRTDFNDIQILPAGRRHSQSTELIASERMARVIYELATRYPDRLIIVDSPPILATSEAQALAQKVGQVVLIIESGVTQQQQVFETLDSLDRDMPINVILNKCMHANSGGYYGGRYGLYGFSDD